MPRKKRVIRVISRQEGLVEEAITETFTLRQDLPDGGVIRHDGETLWLGSNGMSWYGVMPPAWDPLKAVSENFTRRYEIEADYS